MGKCCVCGKVGVFFAHGRWWCVEHYNFASEDLEKVPGFEVEGEKGSSVELGPGKL